MCVRYHPPLHGEVALAQRIERAESAFCAAGGGAAARSLEAGWGRAVYVAQGSPVKVSDIDLKRWTRAIARRGAAGIELCPLMALDVRPRLAARGFELHEFEGELGCRLPVGSRVSAAAACVSGR